MILDTTIKRPALRYYGGKWRIAPWIISHFPEHKNYVEPCGGAASVLLQKPRSLLETYNDLDGNVVNFFRVLRDKPGELIRKIKYTPWSRFEYELSRDCLMKGDEIERARRFWIAGWQSISGGPDPSQCSSGWRCWSSEDRMDALAWEVLEAIATRLTRVQIDNRNMLEVIERCDTPETLIYFDPPYIQDTRAHKTHYRIEFDYSDHIKAANQLHQTKGYVVVSGYAHPLYTELYEDKGWIRTDKETQTNSGGKKIESLWLSPRTFNALSLPKQLSF